MRANSGYTTWFNVQNAGSGTATVSVAFAAGLDGTDWTHPDVTIEPGAAYTFDQTDMTNLGAVFVGSATVTSDQPIVATVVEVGPTTLYAYDGFTDGDPAIVGPLFQYYNAGFSSSVQVQNTGSTATTVTLDYTPSFAGVACEETQTIQPGAAGTFGLFAFAVAGNDCNTKNPGTAFVGSVTVQTNSANEDLVAIVNQHNFSTGKASAYSAFRPDEAKQCTSLPRPWTATATTGPASASSMLAQRPTSPSTILRPCKRGHRPDAGESAITLNMNALGLVTLTSQCPAPTRATRSWSS
jgi:hypothetical protein